MPKPTKPKKKINAPLQMVKTLQRRLTVRTAMQAEVVQEEDLKRRAIKLHIRGKDHDYISQKLHITNEQTHKFITEKLKQYISAENFDSSEVKEVIARRYDSALTMAMYMAFPHPMVDEFDRPLMGNTCQCTLADPMQLCSEPGHVAQLVSKPDPEWLKIYLQVLAEQKKMYGVDAADKMKQTIVDKLERTYKGVDPKVIDAL